MRTRNPEGTSVSSPRPFEPIPTPQIGVGSRLLVGHYPNTPAIVIEVKDGASKTGPYYRVRLSENIESAVGGGLPHPVVPWLWTPNHGIWVGAEAEPAAPYVPDFSARCFGPPLCETCAEDLELMRSGRW